MSSIVLLGVGIVWTVLPKVVVFVQAAHVLLSQIGRETFDLLLIGWFFFHLAFACAFLIFFRIFLAVLQNKIIFPRFLRYQWALSDVLSRIQLTCLTLCQKTENFC